MLSDGAEYACTEYGVSHVRIARHVLWMRESAGKFPVSASISSASQSLLFLFFFGRVRKR